jgi:hypothetical protein
MFVKAPGQTDGEVNESLMRTLDVTPTIADLLNARLDWRHDGHSAFAPATERRDAVVLPTRDFSRIIRIDLPDLERRRAANRRRRAALVGTGAESNERYGSPWATVYRVGSHPELVGRSVDEVGRAPAGVVRATVANASLLRDVRPGDEVVPTRVTGRLVGGPPTGLRDVAVAVDGKVWATGRSFRLRGRSHEYYSLLMPEDALRPGRNEIEVLEVRADGKLATLYRGP